MTNLLQENTEIESHRTLHTFAIRRADAENQNCKRAYNAYADRKRLANNMKRLK